MTRLLAGLAGGALLLLPGVALAHSPIPGIGGFYNGLLHPLLVPAHLLVLIGLGLWLGQQALPRIEAALIAFSLLLAVGLALAAFVAPGAGQTSLLLACALGVGLLVAAARPLPRYATAAVAGLIALLVGLDSAPDAAGTQATLIVLLGVGVGVHLLLLNIVALTSYAHQPWLKVGVRVLGSWSAASALLVLALALRR
jgi:urease accessory protein